MTVRHVERVVRRPTIVKAVSPDSWDAALGHFIDFVIRHRVPLVNRDWVEPGVVRSSSARNIKVRHGFVQVMEDGWMKLEPGLHQILAKGQPHSHVVTVVIVGDILPPVEQRDRGFGWILLSIKIGIDKSVSSVGIEDRSEHDD